MQLLPPELAVELQKRLLRGEHLSLLGPRGSGKSTLLRGCTRVSGCRHSVCIFECHHVLSTTSPVHSSGRIPAWAGGHHTPCGAWAALGCRGPARRRVAAGSFLLCQQRNGVLSEAAARADCGRADCGGYRGAEGSLPNSSAVPLRGDVDTNAAHADRQLRRLLYTLTGGLGLPPLAPRLEQKLLESARGRPGWIVKCMELACEPRYWCEHGLLVSALCVDTEAAVRYRRWTCCGRRQPHRAGPAPIAWR